MIFDDYALVDNVLEAQRRRLSAFVDTFAIRVRVRRDDGCGVGDEGEPEPPARYNCAVLEVGAGVVVPSIRMHAEELGRVSAGGLVRVNPSRRECEEMHVHHLRGKYWPLVARGHDALAAIADGCIGVGRGVSASDA